MTEAFELPKTPDGEPRLRRRIPHRDDGDPRQAWLDLILRVSDPEIIAALTSRAPGEERQRFAESALRIGVLALEQARGRIDAGTLQVESDRLLSDMERRLDEHQQSLTLKMATSLKEYFDPQSGRFTERVERLVRKDGELETLLRRQIGGEDSELARTLTSRLGQDSPLMKQLDPQATGGILEALGRTVDSALGVQRERILQEFSLDNREGALGRLVRELDERHGKLTENLQGSIRNVVHEFSLDDENSALSRLVQRVERAQRQISSEFSLDEKASALARLKGELLEVLDAHRETSRKFQEEVRTALAEMSVRREQASRTPKHGVDFEEDVALFLQNEAQRIGDVATRTGNQTGLIKNCKVGDIVIEMGPEAAAAGARIAVEAKEASGYTLAAVLKEIDIARKNRGAAVGLFVFSARNAPEGLDSLTRYANDVVVVWNAQDPSTDLYLAGGLSVARALSTRQRVLRDGQEADFESIERAIRDIEKQCEGLDEITRVGETILGGSKKILDRARIIKNSLQRQITVLDERIEDLESILEIGDHGA